MCNAHCRRVQTLSRGYATSTPQWHILPVGYIALSKSHPQLDQFTHFRKNMPAILYWLQWTPHIHFQNCPSPVAGAIPILGPSRPIIQNGIQIQSAIFFHNPPDRPTDGQTDRLTDQQMVQATKPVPIPDFVVLMIATRLIIINFYQSQLQYLQPSHCRLSAPRFYRAMHVVCPSVCLWRRWIMTT